MSAINAEVDAAVKSLFSVKDYFVAEEGAAEYSVEYDPARSEANFLTLLEMLKKPDYSAQMYGDTDHATLTVVKNPPPPKPKGAVRLSAPAFLFLLALLSVLITGYVVSIVFPQLSPGSSPLEMEVGFVGALLAVFAARYLGERLAARRGNFSSVSYYLPNVPIFVTIPTMYFLPTFGSVSFPGSPPANRNRLFDFYLAGSLAMLAVSVVIALLTASTTVVLNQAQVAAQASGNSTLQVNPSAIQSGALWLSQRLGTTGQVPVGGELVFSPLEIAAWLGLLLCFFNLLPAALFDGGRMARLALGERGSKATTMASGALLLLVDIPQYWVVFLLVFLMAAFPTQGETLDSISGLSTSRRTALVVMVLLGLLCIPIPQTFATFGL